ncbi:response regulator transcription factor [Pseudomonas resinovorans]|nr:response regulator transcription factor [Pseudomonas resinovorans]MDE3737289.1 response regulator transcription factor [Pseudomonas resinovorans]
MLVDCRPLVLRGLQELVDAMKPRMEVVGQATSYGCALDAVASLRPDVILLSFFADPLDSLCAIQRFVHDGRARVLVLRDHRETVPATDVLAAGAIDIVQVDDSGEAIVQTILRVGQSPIELGQGRSPGRVQQESVVPMIKMEPARHAQLTAREMQLIRVIVGAPSAKYISIAEQLGISEHTVHNHLSNIYHKLNVINRIDLLMYAMKHGLLDNEEPPDRTWA